MSDDDELLKRLGALVRSGDRADLWKQLEDADPDAPLPEPLASAAEVSPEWSELVKAARPVDESLEREIVAAVVAARPELIAADGPPDPKRSRAPAPALWRAWPAAGVAAAMLAAALFIRDPGAGVAPLPEYTVYIGDEPASVLELPRDEMGDVMAQPRAPLAIELTPEVAYSGDLALYIFKKTKAGWHRVETDPPDLSSDGALRLRGLDYKALEGVDTITLMIVRGSVAAPKTPHLCAKTDCVQRELQVQ